MDERAILLNNGGYIDKVYFCPHHPEFGIVNIKM